MKLINIVVRFSIPVVPLLSGTFSRRIYTVNLPKTGSTGITVYDNDSNVYQDQVMFLCLFLTYKNSKLFRK